jgi:maltooligosyltrehalose trehalohydrolase
MIRSHRMPFGAQLQRDGYVRFRIWAPAAKEVTLCLEDQRSTSLPLNPAQDGWFELTSDQATVGTKYSFQINQGTKVPDPASRFQPGDVHGPSEVVNPGAFDWTDSDWRGRPWEEAAIYELHVGTFTPESTFHALELKLGYLRDLGVTAVELMPVADFPGARNWGYDGVLPYAPDSSYGRPDDLKRLVQSAHSNGLMIFLDVVYNHFGPEGNYLHQYAPQFFTKRHQTPWGDAINFDGPDSRVVRDYFIHNAVYWLEEYHFDGLRLDAVHSIVDDSTPDILTELAETVRRTVGQDRHVHLILENADNSASYLAPGSRNKLQLYDAQWNDDVHHAMHVVLTGESDGYYSDYVHGPVKHLCRCLREGFAYQGDYSEYHSSERGEPSAHLPLSAFISFLQNHDQIGNRAFGDRISQLAPAHAVRAAMEILLLAPSPPMLFMGEEFAATSPFLYFCDYHGDLAKAVTNGRRNEFSSFAKFSSPEMRDSIPDPNDEQTFLKSKLDWTNLSDSSHSNWLDFYRNLLSIRQRVVVPHLKGKSESICRSSENPRALSIDWTFADRIHLELRANLGNATCENISPGSGTVFYHGHSKAESAPSSGVLPPWSVIWALHS